MFLTLPFCFIELPKMMADPNLVVQPGWILMSAVAAFGARRRRPAPRCCALCLPCAAATPRSALLWRLAARRPASRAARPHRAPQSPAPPAALNMSVFLLIGKTSALTMNVAGVLKDWLLIIVSVLMYK
jgi:hypothetical protein